MASEADVARKINELRERYEPFTRVVAAVDASQATIDGLSAGPAGALLLVHHGLLWDGNVPLTGRRYRRVAALLEQDAALYAAHIPLDLHPEVGNNVVLAERLGIELVPAIEMSCVHEYAEDLHVCGYWVDLGRIAPACERAQHERVTRAGEIVDKLRAEGFDLHLEDAVREAGDALSIGRPHIARAAGATGDLGPFFEEYLVPGAKAFVPRRWPTAEQAIELIHAAGGVAVIAHPYWDISAPLEVDDLIRSLGADGVETFYPTHSEEQTRHLLELCDELGLIPTASSDYHGPTHKTFAEFGAYDTYGLAEPQVPERVR